jgi:aarF domain-containing kinase
MLRVRKRSVLLFPALGGLGVTAYYQSNNAVQREWDAFFESYMRIFRLMGTVGAMTFDYAYQLYVKDKDFREKIDSSRRMLRKLQEEQERLHLKMFEIQKTKPLSANAKRSIEIEKDQLLSCIKKNEDDIDFQGDIVADLAQQSKERYSDIHVRNATRLRDMCAKNKGLYIKLGQHLAMQDYAFPAEYLEILRCLLANNPVSPYDSVRRVFREEFGKDLEEVFDKFEKKPIASASLAQVHIAWKDDKKYAVKIQHDGLLYGSAIDRLVITKLVDLMPRIFPDFRYQWLTREMNLNLPLELDFRIEANNIFKATTNLQRMIASGDVAVPFVENELSSQRVLTMSYEDGVYVTNESQLQSWGLNRTQISQAISRIFGEQIFRHGFVHCDPHEANLLVRPHPWIPKRAQIVLLDHGLYRQLGTQFRHDYVRLWRSILMRDEENIEKYCRRLNAGDMYSLLAAMLTMKPWNDIVTRTGKDRLAEKDKDAQLVMLQSYAALYYQEIVNLLNDVPSDLLLLFKTNDCLRHLDRVLKTPVNSTAGKLFMITCICIQWTYNL